jgi:SSS family solute:Na+ symporter
LLRWRWRFARRGHDHQGAKEFLRHRASLARCCSSSSLWGNLQRGQHVGLSGGRIRQGGRVHQLVLWLYPAVGFGSLCCGAADLAGRGAWAATIPDFFGRHFESRTLELVMALSAITLLIPVGTTQFLGLKIVLASLGLPVPPLVLVMMAGALPFSMW